MGHTEINAFGDCVRRIGLGRFATVVELRIPCVYACGVSIYDDKVVYPDAVQFELMINSYNKVYSMNKTYLYGNVSPQTYIYYRDNEKVYVEIIKYSDFTKNTEKELRDKYENF